MQTRNITWYRNFMNTKEKHEQPVAIHPLNNGKMLLIYPGAEGDIDGYNRKYETLANYIVEQGLASVLRTGNPYVGRWDTCLRNMLNYALEHSKEICGSDKPEIYLMGFSAGAGAISQLAWEYPEVTKILLLAPAIGVGEKEVIKGLKEFKGEVYIVIGDSDEAVKPEAGQMFYDFCIGSSKRELFVIENCDHQFRGEKNGRILSQAPFYAFLDSKQTFPANSKGIHLYD